MSVSQVLRETLDLMGLNQSALAKKLGVSQGTISKWMAETVSPNKKQWDAVQALIAKHPKTRHMADAAEPAPSGRMVRVVGYVGAGTKAHFYDVSEGDFDEVPAPHGATDATVAVEIRGDSLGKTFNRWVAFYDDVRRPVTEDLVGELCVVGLESGQVLVKTIRRDARGRLNLTSENADPIENVKLKWAAVVKQLARKS